MSISLMEHDQIIREVFAGTGAELPSDSIGQDNKNRETFNEELFLIDSYGVNSLRVKSLFLKKNAYVIVVRSLFLFSMALLCILWVVVQFNSQEEQIIALNNDVLDLPHIKDDIALLKLEQRHFSELNVAKFAEFSAERANMSAEISGLRKSIFVIDHKIDQNIADARGRDDALNLRLSTLEAQTSNHLSASRTLPRRVESALPQMVTAFRDKMEDFRGLRLVNVSGDMATIEGPKGSIQVSVGDDVPGLGIIAKIKRRGSNLLLVATHRTLSAKLRQAVGANEPLRIDLEHDTIDVPDMVELTSKSFVKKARSIRHRRPSRSRS